jgi:hypothetical protein
MVSRTLKPRRDEIIPVDYSSITDPSKASIKELDLGTLRKVMKNMGIRRRPLEDFDKSKMFLISKAGPHGPATLTCYKSMYFFNE